MLRQGCPGSGKRKESMTEMRQFKKRMANMEALRLLAMMMVVSLHYLGKGNVLGELTGPLSAKDHAAWLLESFSIAAVDVYVLISGYFLVETKFRSRRLVTLILQILFYACLIPAVLIPAGLLTPGKLTLYDVWQCIFPINMKQYWFMSAYVLLFLFTPVLNAAVHAVKKEQLQGIILLLLVAESLGKTVIPARLALDSEGYDVLWFMTVYLIAAYIRLYGIAFLEKKRTALLCYGAACLGIYGLLMAIRGAFLFTGRFEDFMKSPTGYNHLLTIGAAVALFYVFKNMEFGKRKSRFADLVCKIAPYSLGVYLLHEQLYVRYEWPVWLGAKKCTSVGTLLWHWIAAVLIVMGCGLLADYGRSLLFRGAGKLFAGGRIDRALQKLDCRVNGE